MCHPGPLPADAYRLAIAASDASDAVRPDATSGAHLARPALVAVCAEKLAAPALDVPAQDAKHCPRVPPEPYTPGAVRSAA
jgi:hypothetical protein